MFVQKDLPVIKKELMRGRVVVGSDFHVPFHDDKAVDRFIDYITDTQPEVVVIAGDLLDFYKLSKYVKGPGRNPEDEIVEAKKILASIRDKVPYADIYYTIGNHESRLENYVFTKAPDLAGIVENFYDLVGCKALNIIPCHRVEFNKDQLVVYHGKFVGQRAGQSALKELLAHPFKIGICGHTHRLIKLIYRMFGIKRIQIENGHLGTMDPHYLLDPDWQQGFSEVIFDNWEAINADVLEIEDGKII